MRKPIIPHHSSAWKLPHTSVIAGIILVSKKMRSGNKGSVLTSNNHLKGRDGKIRFYKPYEDEVA